MTPAGSDIGEYYQLLMMGETSPETCRADEEQ
jgi:hypothetical protein